MITYTESPFLEVVMGAKKKRSKQAGKNAAKVKQEKQSKKAGKGRK